MEAPFWLSLGGIILFGAGIWLILSKASFVMALMGVELMLNAANLNFIAFSLNDPNREGEVAVLFVLALAAAEAAIALALILRAYRRYGTIDLTLLRVLREKN